MNAAKRKAYQEKADAELRAWNARIDELLARAEARRAEGRIELEDRIEQLRRQRASVSEQLAELKEASSDAWEDMREIFEQAHYKLSSAFHTALDRVGNERGEQLSFRPASEDRSDSASSHR